MRGEEGSDGLAAEICGKCGGFHFLARITLRQNLDKQTMTLGGLAVP